LFISTRQGFFYCATRNLKNSLLKFRQLGLQGMFPRRKSAEIHGDILSFAIQGLWAEIWPIWFSDLGLHTPTQDFWASETESAISRPLLLEFRFCAIETKAPGELCRFPFEDRPQKFLLALKKAPQISLDVAFSNRAAGPLAPPGLLRGAFRPPNRTLQRPEAQKARPEFSQASPQASFKGPKPGAKRGLCENREKFGLLGRASQKRSPGVF
jgi:hypothetical protein